MARTLVVGIGSPHGNDQLGWLVIDALAEAGLEETVQLLKLDALHQLLPALEGVEVLLIVDAVVSGATLGILHRFDESQIEGDGVVSSSHTIDLTTLLDTAKALGWQPERLRLYGVEVGCVDMGSRIDGKVVSAVLELTAMITADLGANDT